MVPLVPVDARLERDVDVRYETVTAGAPRAENVGPRDIRWEQTGTGAESSHALRRDTPCDTRAAAMGAAG